MPSLIRSINISKYIGDLTLFEDVSFEIREGDKLALIGVNGAGKTSLLNILAGLNAPDSGIIELTGDKKTAYLKQDDRLPEDKTILEALFESDNPQLNHIREYEEAIVSGDVQTIEAAGAEMDRLKLWDFETRIKQVLTQLNILDYHQKIRELSGGQKKRIALANVILNEPDLLILDEPTNHLDLDAIEWLESYLIRSSLSLIIVTHDRFFLDRVCNRILEIDQKRLYSYEGNYSLFVKARAKRLSLEQQEVDKAKNLLRKEEDWMRRMPKARGSKARYRIDQYYQLKKVSSKRRDEKSMQLNISETRSGSKILVAKSLNFSWYGISYLKDFNYTFSRFEKIGIIGGNGAGKSTFLEILMQNLDPDSGILEVGETMKFGYFTQQGPNFREDMRVIEAITEIAETVAIADGYRITASQFLSYFLFPPPRQNDYIYNLSGGEKRRLHLCRVLMQNPNFLILDEPTNDLDIASLQVLEEYLAGFNGCVLVVSHDRYFMDRIIDHLFIFSGEGEIRDFPGNYSDFFNWQKKQKKEETALTRESSAAVKKPVSGNRTGLSYMEKKELETLEKDIEALEKEKTSLEEELGSGMLGSDILIEKSERIGVILKELEQRTDRWFELSDRESKT